MLSFYKFKNLEKYDKVLHVITKKDITKPYAFSLALHTNENRASIIKNRKALEATLDGANLKFIVANQTHSSNVKIINNSSTKGWESSLDAIEDCDALITNLPNIMLTILTADCVPILLYDKKQQVIAAIHAGWRGTKEQIVTKTVQKMIKHYNSKTKDIEAGIAPSIGQCCYEVGEDVAKYFSNLPHNCQAKSDGKFMLNLPQINKEQLLNIGLEEKNIELSNICTSCSVNNYFSYRKEQGCSGRFMTLIGLTTTSKII